MQVHTFFAIKSMKKILIVASIFSLIGCNLIRNESYDPFRSHHATSGFRNPTVEERAKKRGVMRWLTDVLQANIEADNLKEIPQLVTPNFEKIYDPYPDAIQVTWIGHATFLIQMQGMNILTDPVFSHRASPVQFIGPTRKQPPGIAIGELPPIDIVIISHNHYDHLDINSVRALGDDILYLAPLGLKQWFRDKNVVHHRELDWWQTAKITGFNFTFVPAQHFSGRLILDLNKSLWGGWVIEKNGRKVYFAGDTGYSNVFRQIGARIGPMDVSMIPIGAYAPRDILKFLHSDPYDAVKIHQDVKSHYSIGMHWGTFRLTTEPLGEPKQLLKKAAIKAGLEHEEFVTFNVGETRIYY